MIRKIDNVRMRTSYIGIKTERKFFFWRRTKPDRQKALEDAMQCIGGFDEWMQIYYGNRERDA